MRTTRRRLTSSAALAAAAAVTFTVGVLVPGAGAANQATNLDQCANGSAGSTTCTWQNGDLNHSNALYREGDSVPFRAVLTNLSPGAHTLVLQFDTEQNGKHAYDYLTRFDRTVTGADPCAGVAPCGGPGSPSPTIPLSVSPAPPDIGLVSGPDRYFTIWNGSISKVTLGGASDVTDEQQSVTISFSATDPTVVIAWGGHVADEITWPKGMGAGSISGSPYHVRVIALDGQGGNQDRSMKADTVPPAPPTFTTDVEDAGAPGTFVGSISPGGAVADAAALAGADGPVTGTVSFYVCHADAGPPDCTTGGDAVGSPVPVSAAGTATSASFQPDPASGTYCFRAEYVPDSEAFYSPAHETNQTIESGGNHGECFTVQTEASPPPPPPAPPPPAPAPGAPSLPAPSTPSSPAAAPSVDLAIAKTVAPNPVSRNTVATWTETVTNDGPDGATGVTVDDPLPAGLALVSTAATQGSCTTAGQAVQCSLGDLASGASAAITISTRATRAGFLVNTATVAGNEPDSDTANNRASATLDVTAPLLPPVAKPKQKPKARPRPKPHPKPRPQPKPRPKPKPKPKPKVYCTALAVAPRTIFAGRTSVLTLHLAKHGKAVAGVRVRLRGKPVHLLTRRSNRTGVVKVRVRPRRAGIVAFHPASGKPCNTPRIGVTSVFTPPITG